jgi:PAS domain S-box-containing protein
VPPSRRTAELTASNQHLDGQFDELTARSALRATWIAGLASMLPALARSEAAWYYAVHAGVLLAAGGVLTAYRRRLTPTTVARAVLVLGVAVIASASIVTGASFSPAYHAYAVVIVAAIWLVLPPRPAMLCTTGVVAAGAGLAMATQLALTPVPLVDHTPWSAWLTTSAACAVMAAVQWLEVHRLRASRAALGQQLRYSEEAQWQARDSERRYAEVVSMAPGVVYELEVRPDGARAFTFISEGARRLFDCAPEEILADRRVLQGMIETAAERERFDTSMAQSLATLAPWEIETTIRTSAGHRRWIRGQSVPTRLADGRVRWHGVLSDITERIKTEHALRESQAALKQSVSLLQSTFESTADGLLTVDVRGRVTGVNQKFLALWRVPPAIAATKDDDQLLRHVSGQLIDPDGFLAKVKDLYARPEAVSFDVVEFKDGRRYERYSQPQVVDGEVVGRVWSFRDVTARVDDERRRAELEQRLQQAHTLEALGALAGGIAHDFNNLLTVVMGNAEQAAVEPDETVRRGNLESITQAAHRAGALVREIREFSRPRPAERTVVTVASTIRSAIQLLRTTMPKHLALETTLDPAVTMFANATQVQQVVTNLVLNAVQGTGDAGGRIVVALDDVAAADVPAATPRPLADRYARLQVADTGRGIDADVLPRIFEPFYSTKVDAPGSGLGLAVVHGIVRRYHGTVVVDSVPGRGTTFQVYWPALPPATEPVEPPPTGVAAGTPSGHGGRILVVDDEPDVVKVIADGLRRLGYGVTSATDPREALTQFAAAPAAFDAVLSDLSMPHLTGLELGRRMLDLRPGTPIVLFTGHAAELSPDEVRAAGFRAVLNKPMSLAVLAEALHRALGDAAPAIP